MTTGETRALFKLPGHTPSSCLISSDIVKTTLGTCECDGVGQCKYTVGQWRP